MATDFWIVHRIFQIDHLQKGRTITGEFNAKLSDRFKDDYKKKLWQLDMMKGLIHQDNSRVQTCMYIVRWKQMWIQR